MLTQRFMWTLRGLNQLNRFKFAQVKKAGPNFQEDFSEILLATEKKQQTTTGRSWKAEQLRLKSNQDLHKLWFVCVKEKNLLLADQVLEKKISQNRVLHYRVNKVTKTMNRILGVVRERQLIRKQYRLKLQQEYIQKKRQELQAKVKKEQEQIPQITWQMLRAKYLDLRRGIDNVKYLEKIWQQKDQQAGRVERMHERLKTNRPKKFTSFWDYEVSIGQRPLQQEVLRTHIRNWRSLNLKQRKIILGFLNARRSKDAKAAFIKQLKILGDKIAQDQVKARIEGSNTQ